MRNSSAFLDSLPQLPPGVWWCRTCFEVQLISATDHFFHSYGNDNIEEEEDEQVNEQDAFVRKHYAHTLVALKKKKDRYFADRPAWDPLRIAYEEVTDGRENFILKSWRTNLDEPRRYTLLRGAISIVTTVRLPEEPLCEELEQAFSCSFSQANATVQKLQHLVASLPPEELVLTYCAADTPQVLFSHLSEHHVQQCVKLCKAEGLSPDETKLRDFFLRQQGEEALTVELHQHCELQYS